MGRGIRQEKGGLYRIYYRRNVTFLIDGRKIRFSRKEAYALGLFFSVKNKLPCFSFN